MWEDFLINMGVSALLTAIKNEQKQKTMRRTFLKVFKVIWSIYQNDEEFQQAVSVKDTSTD